MSAGDNINVSRLKNIYNNVEKIGIGTTNPSSILHIVGNSTPAASSTLIKYPKQNMSSDTLTYTDGKIIRVVASSVYNYNALRPYNAFDGGKVYNGWWGIDPAYINGIAQTPTSATVKTGYAGGWLMIDLGEAIYLYSINLHSTLSNGVDAKLRKPKTFKLYASNILEAFNNINHSSWVDIYTGSDPSSTPTSLTSYTIDCKIMYQYYVIVVNTTYGEATANGCQITELEFFTYVQSEDFINIFELNGLNSIANPSQASFKLSRWENSTTNSRTRLDVNLSHTLNYDVNTLSIRSDGRIGIGTTSPGSTLDVSGNIMATNIQIGAVANAFFPRGVIVIWYSSIASIPIGWAICDGTNSTPDLRNLFIIGAGNTYSVSAIGGTATTTLSVENLPAHSHTGTTDNSGAHSHTQRHGHYDDFNWTGNSGWPPPQDGVNNSINNSTYNIDSNNSAHTHTFTTANTGSGTAFNTLPPYYALAYIMKL